MIFSDDGAPVVIGSYQWRKNQTFDLTARIDEAVDAALRFGLTKKYIAENVSEYLLTWEAT